jgi:hypothetical protein
MKEVKMAGRIKCELPATIVIEKGLTKLVLPG